MISLLQFIWYGCWHHWVPQSQGKYEETHAGFLSRSGPIVHCRCSKCGRWKWFWGVLK